MNIREITGKALWLICLAFASSIAMAQQAAEQGTVRLEHTAQQQETYTDENGVEQTRLVAATRVVPGEEILFTVSYTNTGTQPAENISVVNPVPEHMDYVDGSASGSDSVIDFSVDGGKNFGTPQDLVVVDAEGTERPASAQDYTHIRWVIGSNVAPGTSGTVQFRAIVE